MYLSIVGIPGVLSNPTRRATKIKATRLAKNSILTRHPQLFE
jgi:hypothetical protein